VTQVALKDNPPPPGPSSFTRPEESMLFQLLSRVFLTHSSPSAISPSLSRNWCSRYRELCVHFPCNSNLRAPIPDGQQSTTRGIATRDVNGLIFQTPSIEVPIPNQMPPGLHSLPRPHTTMSPHAPCDQKSRDHNFNCRESFALGTPNAETPIL
jgi:hypothetical protein